MNIFAFDDYRDFIKHWIASKEKSHGLHVQMCNAMDCQSAHLSRALQGKIHLTMDQVYLVSDFMALNQAESIFFLKLAEYKRAGNSKYKKKLSEEIASLRLAQQDFNQRHKLKKIEDLENEMNYYSSWHWTAIHFITGIRKYQSPIKIAQRLGLSELFVKRSLEVLEKMGLVKRNDEFWKINPGSIHLPKKSPMNSASHSNWRSRAILSSQDPDKDGLHYTVVQAIGEDDFEKIKQMFLQTIDDYKKVANPSPSEELICFTLDFFKV